METEQRRPVQRARALERLVREATNTVDPMGLLAAGAPEDEYAPEVRAIVGALSRIGPAEAELARTIRDVFDAWFGPGSVPEQRCREIARAICRRWSEVVSE